MDAQDINGLVVEKNDGSHRDKKPRRKRFRVVVVCETDKPDQVRKAEFIVLSDELEQVSRSIHDSSQFIEILDESGLDHFIPKKLILEVVVDGMTVEEREAEMKALMEAEKNKGRVYLDPTKMSSPPTSSPSQHA